MTSGESRSPLHHMMLAASFSVMRIWSFLIRFGTMVPFFPNSLSGDVVEGLCVWMETWQWRPTFDGSPSIRRHDISVWPARLLQVRQAARWSKIVVVSLPSVTELLSTQSISYQHAMEPTELSDAPSPRRGSSCYMGRTHTHTSVWHWRAVSGLFMRASSQWSTSSPPVLCWTPPAGTHTFQTHVCAAHVPSAVCTCAAGPGSSECKQSWGNRIGLCDCSCSSWVFRVRAWTIVKVGS